MKDETPQTPREELEVKVTALLLGELPPEQASILETQIAADPELKSLQTRLGEAIGLVREASTIREQPAPATLARLSSERRERLLKYFKSNVSPVVEPRRKRDWSWVRPLSLAAGIIALIGGGLLLDGSSRSRSISRGGGFVLYDTEGTRSEGVVWESQPGAIRTLSDAERGEARFGAEGNNEYDYVQAVPATATDRFAAPQRGEAQRPWYLAWGGQASSSNSADRKGLRQQPPARTPANDALWAAVPQPPAAAAPVPGLQPASGPSAASAPVVPAEPTMLAGIEPAHPAARGGEAAPGTTEARNLALGAVRELEAKSEFGITALPRSETVAENGARPGYGTVPATGGLLGKNPAQIAGLESAVRAPESKPNLDLFGDDRLAGFAFQTPATRDKAPGLENEVRLSVKSPDSESAITKLNSDGLSVDQGRQTATTLGDAGIAGNRPGVRADGVDALARNKDNLADGSTAGVRFYRGRAIDETRLETRLSEVAGAKVEQKFDGSGGAGLAKNFKDLNSPAGVDEKTDAFFKEQKLGQLLQELPGGTVDAKAATLEKQTEYWEQATSNRAAEIAKLEAKKAAPDQREKAVEEEVKVIEDLAAVPLQRQLKEVDGDAILSKRKVAPPVPQPEVATRENRFSTFSLNVSDVSFKLAAASLENGAMPDAAAIRSEEFINAFDYRDPEPAPRTPLAFASERARYPFAQNRDLLRISVKTAAAGRQPGRALNVVLLVDNSGSMERADRVRILHEALRVLAGQLTPQDKLSIITFARTPRLWIDGVAGDKAGEATARVSEITPQGGTNLAAALDLGYQTALRHYNVQSINRVVLLTDGAANLGNVNAATLKEKVEAHRKQGVALDCFGIGWEGYNDDLLEVLSRNGDGRYGFINSVEEAATVFAAQLAGALRVAAADVKVQVEFNPRRVTAYRQVGYAKHQLTKEQFRDNTVDAAEIGAAEAGNGIYLVEVNPRGAGDLATVRVRFKVPGTSTYREHGWSVPFTPNVAPLAQATIAMRLAGSASAFSEWLAGSPYAGEITTDGLLGLINGVPGAYGVDPRPQKLEWMIRQAKSLSGR